MTENQIQDVKDLCYRVIVSCAATLGSAEFGSGGCVIGPNPKAAELKRVSMDLTRALARLRGRGRF